MLANGICLCENHLLELSRDWAAVTKKGELSNGDHLAAAVAYIRFSGSGLVVAGSTICFTAVLFLPSTLFNPIAMLTAITVLAFGAIGTLVGYDLITIARNRESFVEKKYGFSFLGTMSQEDGQSFENRAHNFTKRTFFDPLWAKWLIAHWNLELKKHLT